MAKNEQSREANQPIWFDGKSINEALLNISRYEGHRYTFEIHQYT